MAKLKAAKRSELGTTGARRLREQGKVPGIIYGHGQDNVPVTLDAHDLELAVSHGERVLELRLGSKNENVLVKELQYDTFGQHIMHVDLTRVSLDERVEVTVPVVLRGAPVEGVVQQMVADISIRCLVTEIPEDIRVPIGHMQVGNVMQLSDLPLPQGAELLDDPETVLCSIIVVAEEAVEVPVEEAEPAAAEPEVVGEVKEETPEEGTKKPQ